MSNARENRPLPSGPRWLGKRGAAGFLRSIAWIGVTYVTRPLVLALVALGLLTLAVELFTGGDKAYWMRAYPQPAAARLDVYSQQTLDGVRAAGRQSEVDSIQLSALWYSMQPQPQLPSHPTPERAPPAAPSVVWKAPTGDFYRVLDEFPNLRRVEYSCFGELTGFDRVVARTELEYLTLDGTCTFDLAQLDSLQQLRELTLQTSKPPEHVEALAKLPNLQTVVFISRMAIDDAVLAALANLPHLKVLVLDFGYYFPYEKQLSRSAFDALAKSNSLESLYIGGRPTIEPAGPTTIEIARAALPKLTIKPAVVEQRFLGRSILPCVPFGLFAAAIGIQLSSQFRSPLRRLAPHFVASHAWIGIVLAVALMAGCAARFTVHGIDLQTAIALSAAGITSMLGSMSLVSLDPPFHWQPSPRISQKISLVPGVVIFTLFMVLLIPNLAQYVLYGSHAWVLASLWLATILSAGVTIWLLNGLVYWSSSVTTAERTNATWQLQGTYRQTWMVALQKREQQIDAWSAREPESWTWWQRVERWRAGNPPVRIIRFALFIGAMMVGSQFVPVMHANRPTEKSLVDGLYFAAAMVLMQVVFQMSMLWRTRMQVLPLELMRPCSRQRLQNEWIVAYVWDLVPGVALASLLAAIGLNLTVSFAIDWPLVPLDFLMLLPSALLVAVGLGSLIVVVRRIWISLVLVWAVCTAAPVMVVLTSVAWGNNTAGGQPLNITAAGILANLWILALLGAVVAAVMGRHWMRADVERTA